MRFFSPCQRTSSGDLLNFSVSLKYSRFFSQLVLGVGDFSVSSSTRCRQRLIVVVLYSQSSRIFYSSCPFFLIWKTNIFPRLIFCDSIFHFGCKRVGLVFCCCFFLRKNDMIPFRKRKYGFISKMLFSKIYVLDES